MLELRYVFFPSAWALRPSEGCEKVFVYLVDVWPAFSSVEVVHVIGQVPRLEVTA